MDFKQTVKEARTELSEAVAMNKARKKNIKMACLKRAKQLIEDYLETERK